MSELTAYLAALALTLAVELPMFVALAGLPSRRQAALDALLANLLTHPMAVFCSWELGCSFGLIELGVWATEACIYARLSGLSWLRAGLISALVNGITAALSFTL